MKTYRQIWDAPGRVYTGQTKKRLRIPYRKLGTVQCISGEITLCFDVYGECPSCNEKVWLGRTEPGTQWVPAVEKNDEDGVFELHRCSEELNRNNALRKLVYGKGVKELDQESSINRTNGENQT